MSVGFLVVYTGEETIRCWLQRKVEERQLHIWNDPCEIEAEMKAFDVGHKIFYLFSTYGDTQNRRFFEAKRIFKHKTLHPGGLKFDFAFL